MNIAVLVIAMCNENTSDVENFLLCATCERRQL